MSLWPCRMDIVLSIFPFLSHFFLILRPLGRVKIGRSRPAAILRSCHRCKGEKWESMDGLYSDFLSLGLAPGGHSWSLSVTRLPVLEQAPPLRAGRYLMKKTGLRKVIPVALLVRPKGWKSVLSSNSAESEPGIQIRVNGGRFRKKRGSSSPLFKTAGGLAAPAFQAPFAGWDSVQGVRMFTYLSMYLIYVWVHVYRERERESGKWVTLGYPGGCK